MSGKHQRVFEAGMLAVSRLVCYSVSPSSCSCNFCSSPLCTDAVCAQQHASLHPACLAFCTASLPITSRSSSCHGRAKDIPPVELPSTYRRSETVGKHSPLGPRQAISSLILHTSSKFPTESSPIAHFMGQHQP